MRNSKLADFKIRPRKAGYQNFSFLFFNFKFKQGFTIIELLVVIAIIAILASVIWTNLNSAKIKARDARRRLDLGQLQLALELFFDKNNSYPSTGGAWWGVSQNGGSKTTAGVNAYIPQVTPTYIRVLPVDPLDKRTGWAGYLYNSDGSHYKIIALDAESFPESNAFYDPVRPTWAWMLCDNEPACSSW